MQGDFAGTMGRAGQHRCSEMPSNGSVVEGFSVDIIKTELKSESGCV